MAKNVMNRKFTLREKILMLVLVCILLIGLYFLLVFFPVQRQLDDLEAQQNDILDSMVVLQARETVYDKMNAELQEIAKMEQDGQTITVMPEYDNSKNLLLGFHEIFQGIEPTINYEASLSRSGNIVARGVTFSFNIAGFQDENFPTDFAKTKDTLRRLMQIPYTDPDDPDLVRTCRCIMNSVSLSPDAGDIENNSLVVSCTMTFYEIEKA